MMNGALLGVVVVAAIGVILWATVLVGVKLAEKMTTGQDEW